MAGAADVLLLCGDLTSYGLLKEAEVLAHELDGVGVPTLAVLGNHDHEADQGAQIARILHKVGVRVLDGEICETAGIGFAGVKGFGGGFGEYALQAWGETAIKRFVREALDEAVKLETALARLRVPRRVVLLHYAPVAATVEGEPLVIYPFLGSSRLEDPIDRFSVTAVFHGHAHGGAPEGRTRGDTPVYNVALPVLARCYPDRPRFRVLELTVSTEATESLHADTFGR
jgi:Icc-related predicted phosphoesterase